MKAYTDLEQSKRLSKILPLESADMSWAGTGLGKPFARTIPCKGYPEEICPCWSLAALLEFFPEFKIEKTKAEDGYEGYYYFVSYKNLIAVPYNKELIDGFVEMIVRLKNEDLL